MIFLPMLPSTLYFRFFETLASTPRLDRTKHPMKFYRFDAIKPPDDVW